MTRTVYIDGDIVSYRCGFAAEHTTYEATIDGKDMAFDGKAAMNKYLKEHPSSGEMFWKSTLHVEPLDFVLSTVKQMISNIVIGAKADNYVMYLSSRTNFRDRIATVFKYKGNRDGVRRPMHHDEVLRYLTDIHGAITQEGYEADDLLADSLVASGGTAVLASIDKDLLQVPGEHFNFVTGKFKTVTKEEGLVNLYTQMLTGDSTDNIPGIGGTGPVTAEKLLRVVEPNEEALRNAVAQAWYHYLDGPKPPEWLIKFKDGYLKYEHWYEQAPRIVTLDEFLDELDALLRVGVPPVPKWSVISDE